MSFRFRSAFPIFVCFLISQPAFSQIIWQENFSGPNQGWTQNFTDCDAPGFAGVQNNRFEVTDMEGAPCCPTGGGNDNEWVTNDIAINNYCSVSISVDYGSIGVFECVAGGPYYGCSGNVSIDNGHDQMVFEYSLNGGPFIQFFYVCGGTAGIASINGLSGNTIRVRISAANKAVAETYWFDNVTVTGVATPTVNQPNDVTVCAGQNAPVVFTGTGTPAPTFSWTNNSTAVGLAASGNGNLTISPPANLAAQQMATVTVTPTSAGCTGTPVTF
ncbi:MAG: hypothetical protein IPJ82_20365 [Lewinellaceae bacterium]|nr:hypothetical protein [Lewinellaceae bacterium]